MVRSRLSSFAALVLIFSLYCRGWGGRSSRNQNLWVCFKAMVRINMQRSQFETSWEDRHWKWCGHKRNQQPTRKELLRISHNLNMLCFIWRSTGKHSFVSLQMPILFRASKRETQSSHADLWLLFHPLTLMGRLIRSAGGNREDCDYAEDVLELVMQQRARERKEGRVVGDSYLLQVQRQRD